MPGVHTRFRRLWVFRSCLLAALVSRCYFQTKCRPWRLSLFGRRLFCGECRIGAPGHEMGAYMDRLPGLFRQNVPSRLLNLTGIDAS